MDKSKLQFDKYVDSIISVLKSEGVDPNNQKDVEKALSECVGAKKLIAFYQENKSHVLSMVYTYER